ncbi:uncharacterized protein CXQ87_005000 [Candidozyma duobushaemuli]|uniref:Zn(2)-C6 fungal-type domain-containing protein n=2 Tax=Candidozyma TaxID=3303203 RepID=A0ABX8IAZ1_9ASCO|nr:uncharacterized protein CXQ87_005000 [[Candida] duobushaemulonis]PVH16704.1 hypothetical protein CXQ87_005000 [[Candida] duobushaemulonis]QWU90451.1 hypothetical protein CA3LBN_004812 [[Candida] haemuloni]
MGYKEYQGVLQLKAHKIVSRKPTKSYKRSVKGCFSCKRRKIKCDETKGKCMNCVRRDLECQYPEMKSSETEEEQIQDIDIGPSQLATLVPRNHLSIQIDSIFLVQFAQRFLPTLAQPHFNHKVPTQSLVHSVAEKSDLLRQMSIACGASLVAFDDQAFRAVAQKRYVSALSLFIKTMKNGVLGSEEWLFLAIQVLQTLSLRDPTMGCNATRCAVHLSAAYELFMKNILQSHASVSSLERAMIENFLFNYSLTIMFCDDAQIEKLIPSPFGLFSTHYQRFFELCQDYEDPASSRLSITAFQIAAKASWSCRLRLPLADSDKLLHCELLQLAETCLLTSETLSAPTVQIFDTLTVAKVVLHTSMILLRKMLDPGLRASILQPSIDALVRLVGDSNEYVVIPIWSSFIAASAATADSDRRFFIHTLQKLGTRSGSHLINRASSYLEGLWEIYGGDEPFGLLLDTRALTAVSHDSGQDAALG